VGPTLLSNNALNPPPLQPLTRAAAVPSLAEDARSARVNASPLCGQGGSILVVGNGRRP